MAAAAAGIRVSVQMGKRKQVVAHHVSCASAVNHLPACVQSTTAAAALPGLGPPFPLSAQLHVMQPALALPCHASASCLYPVHHSPLPSPPHLNPSMSALRSSLRPMNTIWLMRGSVSPQGLSLGP